MQFANMIYKDIEEVKTFTGGAVNMSVHLDSVKPVMYITAGKHLVGWLGQEQWKEIVTDYETAAGDLVLLLPYVQRPLALLTFFEYAAVGSVQFSEIGMIRMETAETKSAYKYQENGYKDWMLHSGYDMLEEMLLFLQANKAKYQKWATSTAAEKNEELLMNYASEFRAAYSKHLSRYTFECLRPILEDLETFAIEPLIGRPLMDKLKENSKAATLTDPQKALLKILHKALANFTIEQALKRHWVKVVGRDVFQTEKLDSQSYSKESVPKTQAMSTKMLHHDNWGNRHTSNARRYIESNIDDFPEYKEYLNLQLGLAADATDEERAARVKELALLKEYDYSGACSCPSPAECTCDNVEIDHRLTNNYNPPKRKNQGVVRL